MPELVSDRQRRVRAATVCARTMVFDKRPRASEHPVLAQGQYDEFATEVDRLAAPLRAALPRMALTTYNLGGHGRPGIFVFGTRTATAKYRFPLSILIRWR